MKTGLIRQIGGAGDRTRDAWVQGEWFIHYTMAGLSTTPWRLIRICHKYQNLVQ